MFRTAPEVGEAAEQKSPPNVRLFTQHASNSPDDCHLFGSSKPREKEVLWLRYDTLSFECSTLNSGGAGYWISRSRNETGLCRRLRVHESRAFPENDRGNPTMGTRWRATSLRSCA